MKVLGETRNLPDTGGHGCGVEPGAGFIGMDVIAGEEIFDAIGAEAIILIGYQGIQIDEVSAGGSGRFAGPAAIVGAIAQHPAVFEHISGDRRANDGDSALCFGIGDIFAHVPAVGVHGLVLLHYRVIDIFCRIAESPECAACTSRVVERAAVVVAELHDYKVTRFKLSEHLIPVSFRDKRSAAAAAEGEVTNSDATSVKGFAEVAAPAPEAAIAFAFAVLDGRVADDIQGGAVLDASEDEQEEKVFVHDQNFMSLEFLTWMVEPSFVVTVKLFSCQ